MSLGSKAVGDEFVNGQERSFAARKQCITNLKTPLFQKLKASWVKRPKTFRLKEYAGQKVRRIYDRVLYRKN